MPTLTLRKCRPKKAPNINPASDTMTAVKRRPKPKPKKKVPTIPSDSGATGAAQLAPREDTLKLQIAAETLASLKHTVPNPEPSDFEIDDIGLGLAMGTSMSSDEKAQDSGEEEEEEADSGSDSEEEVDELLDDESDDLKVLKGLEDQGGIIFHPYNLCC